MDLAAERAASIARNEARKAQIWAEAEKEFTAWYQDVGTRAELHTKGHAGANRDKIITTLPKCWCGKATLALGMCGAHYSQWYDRVAGRVRGLRNQRSICHRDRAHHAYGLCRECYSKSIGRAALQLRKLKAVFNDPPKMRQKKNAWRCEHTDRPHHSRGLCASCRHTWRLRGEQLPPKLGRTFCKQLRCIHKGRRHQARGLCASCYSLWIQRKRNPEKYQREPWVKGWPPMCGHEKHYAKGLCKECYRKFQWQNEKTGRVRVRTRYAGETQGGWNDETKPLLCGCKGVRHEAKGCCVKCYNRGVHKTPEFARRLLEGQLPSDVSTEPLRSLG